MFEIAPDALGSVAATAAAGIVPLLVFFALLGIFKWPTHWCALGAVATSVVVAMTYGMPVSMIGSSALYGLVFALSPIIVIVIAAVWLYQLTVTAGRDVDVRRVFSALSRGDKRVAGLLIGLSFCGLLEGLAGFGAPVAIVAAMLVSVGIEPIKAALVTMVGNAISVGTGAMAIPILTTSTLGGEDPSHVAIAASLMTPAIAILVPFALLFILDGMRGIRQLWLVALVQGVVTGLGHTIAARFISFELIAVIASLLAFVATAAVARALTIETPEEFASAEGTLPPTRDIVLGLMPYWLVIIVFGFAKLWRIGIDIPATLSSTDIGITWPGLSGLMDGGEPKNVVYNLQWLSNPALVLAIVAIITGLTYAAYGTMSVADVFRTLGRTISSLALASLTICLVMILAYIMNYSGQTNAVGVALASTGGAFAFLSPALGWLGTAVTGSATASGALFAGLQSTAAHATGVNPQVLLAGNAIGGGLGKIISPQNLAIASTAIGKPGSESTLLSKAAPWSLGFLLVLAVQVLLFS